MVPRCYKSVNGVWEVFAITTAGLQAWVDYIPVRVVATRPASTRNRYENDGWMQVRFLTGPEADAAEAWVDYTPVGNNAAGDDRWSTNQPGGYIPVGTNANA
ncbi:MAG: hypothetical protein QNJ97_17890 [Myxococcota bacterium]|nr:hypothetical protein [Myxococcota bacterium]